MDYDAESAANRPSRIELPARKGDGVRKQQLFGELIKRACRESGAYRGAVVLKHGLAPQLIAAPVYPPDRWPAGFTYASLPIGSTIVRSASVEAFTTQKPCVVADVSAPDSHYFPVDVPGNRRVAAALALPILGRRGPLGVIHLDWVEPQLLDAELIDHLVVLIAGFAKQLDALGGDTEFEDLIRRIEDPNEPEPNYERVIAILSDVTGADGGALFLNRPGDAGRYYLVARVFGPAPGDDPPFYRKGQGLTGWVLGTGRVLELVRIDDPGERATAAPEAGWARHVSDYWAAQHPAGEPRLFDGDNPFLGVPLETTTEGVLGAVRLRRTGTTPFTLLQRFILEGKAERLATAITARRAACRRAAVVALDEKLLGERLPNAILDAMAKAARTVHPSAHMLVRAKAKVGNKSMLLPVYAETPELLEKLGPVGERDALSGWVCSHKLPRYVRDLRDLTGHHLSGVPQDDWRAAYGYPLALRRVHDGAVLFLYDEPSALSPADEGFLRDVCERARGQLAQAFDLQALELSLELHRATTRTLPQLLLGSGTAAAGRPVQELCVELLGHLWKGFQAQRAAVGLIEGGGPSVAWHGPNGARLLDVTLTAPDATATVPLAALVPFVREQLPAGEPVWLDGPAVVAIVCGQTGMPAGLTPELVQWVLRGQRLLLLPLLVQGEPRGVFVFEVPDLTLLSQGLLDAATATLREIGGLIELADRFEAERRTAACRGVLEYIGGKVNNLRHRLRKPLLPIKLALTDELPKVTNLGEVREITVNLVQQFTVFEKLLDEFDADLRRPPEPETDVDLAVVVREAVADTERTQVETPWPVWVRGCRGRLVSAVRRLWENADREVRDRPHGRVMVGLTSTPEGGRIEVRDNGRGMTPEEMAALFRPLESRRGGTGLGLAEVLVTVSDHEGRIDVQAADDGGTIVTLDIPRRLS